MMRRARISLALLAALVLLGCSKDKDVEPPKALVAFQQSLDVQRRWELSLGGKDRRLRLGLAPAIDHGRVYAAGREGDAYALDAATGHVLWRVRTKLPLSGGPAAADGVVAIGTTDGQVVLLDAASGAKRWQVRVSGEVLAAPAIAAQAVIVRTVDGRVRALARDDGHDLWADDEAVPRLSLRGTGRPILAGDAVVSGFDDGKVVAYSLAGGETLWQSTVSAARGRTELERLVDVDGELAVSGRDVFAVGFQGRLSMLALDTGQVWWARDLSSYRGLALDGETLYVTTADSVIEAFRRRDGTPLWTQDKLARRGLTAPAVDGDAIVVADYQGYVHWLDRTTGQLLGRIHTHKDRVTNAPVAADGLVFVQTDANRLYALRARPNGRTPKAAPEQTPAKQPPAKQPPKPGNLPSDLSPTGPH